MLRAGFVSSVCLSSVIADWQPCFVSILSAVHGCHTVLLLSGDRALHVASIVAVKLILNKNT